MWNFHFYFVFFDRSRREGVDRWKVMQKVMQSQAFGSIPGKMSKVNFSWAQNNLTSWLWYLNRALSMFSNISVRSPLLVAGNSVARNLSRRMQTFLMGRGGEKCFHIAYCGKRWGERTQRNSRKSYFSTSYSRSYTLHPSIPLAVQISCKRWTREKKTWLKAIWNFTPVWRKLSENNYLAFSAPSICFGFYFIGFNSYSVFSGAVFGRRYTKWIAAATVDRWSVLGFVTLSAS